MNSHTRSRALWSGTRGQSLVEFALVLPMLLVVAFMVTEFGRALWIKNMLTGAAGNAARCVIVSGAGSYEAVADSAVNHFLSGQGLHMGTEEGTDLTIDFLPTGDPSTADLVRVRLTREFNFVPGGGDGGEMATNQGPKKGIVQFTTINIVGEATMDLQPSFQR